MRFICFLLLPVILCTCSSNKPPRGGSSGLVAESQEAARFFANAQSLEARGKTKKAMKLYEAIAESYPFDVVAPKAKFQHAYLLDKRGDYLKAFELYEQFINKYPRTPLYSQALERQAVMAHAAADGQIKSSFLGISTKMSSNDVEEMLEKVRSNAPQAPSASKALFAIAELRQSKGKLAKAVPAYQRVVDMYPRSQQAPEAQLRVGQILLKISSKGNQDEANIDRAENAYHDLLQLYPNTPQAKQAREALRTISGQNINRSYEIARFYEGKGDKKAAAYYYQEVIDNSKPGPFRDRAARKLKELQVN